MKKGPFSERQLNAALFFFALHNWRACTSSNDQCCGMRAKCFLSLHIGRRSGAAHVFFLGLNLASYHFGEMGILSFPY